jgi:hypothetical protein
MRAACGWERGRSGQANKNKEVIRSGGVDACQKVGMEAGIGQKNNHNEEACSNQRIRGNGDGDLNQHSTMTQRKSPTPRHQT